MPRATRTRSWCPSRKSSPMPKVPDSPAGASPAAFSRTLLPGLGREGWTRRMGHTRSQPRLLTGHHRAGVRQTAGHGAGGDGRLTQIGVTAQQGPTVHLCPWPSTLLRRAVRVPPALGASPGAGLPPQPPERPCKGAKLPGRPSSSCHTTAARRTPSDPGASPGGRPATSLPCSTGASPGLRCSQAGLPLPGASPSRSPCPASGAPALSAGFLSRTSSTT